MRSASVSPPDTAPSGLAALVAQCTAADGHAPFEEHTLLTLDGVRQLPHARAEVRDDGGLAALAVLSEGVAAWSVEVAVRPDVRGCGLGRRVAGEAVEHVRSHGGGTVRAWVHGPARAAHALAGSYGATIERRLLVMRRPLTDLPAVEATTDRLDRDGRDVDDWLALSNAAFAGHPENGGWTRDDLDWRLRTAWTDRSRFPVLRDEHGLVAGVWTKVEPGADVGELYVVAVHPRAAGRGHGRVVVARALHDLREAGCATAELYVDTDNAAALRLYAWAGFAAGAEHHCLTAEVPPA